jgi:hypothetical protein
VAQLDGCGYDAPERLGGSGYDAPALPRAFETDFHVGFPYFPDYDDHRDYIVYNA